MENLGIRFIPAPTEYWEEDGSSHQTFDPEIVYRAYTFWRYADDLATMPTVGELDRATIIGKLWNAVDSRTKLLKRSYNFSKLKTLAGLPRRADDLATMKQLGLVRPAMLSELKAIRNSVEHEDVEAPDLRECIRYIDMVWYFLRSTDRYAENRRMHVDLTPWTPDGLEEKEFISYDYSFPDWEIQVSARLRNTQINTHPANDRTEVRCTEIRAVDEGYSYLRGTLVPSSATQAMYRSYFNPIGAGSHPG